MRVKITTVVIVFVLLWSTSGGAGEIQEEPIADPSLSSVDVSAERQEALRKLATQVKPAAGSEVEITGPKVVPYWQQTVTRSRRRGVSE